MADKFVRTKKSVWASKSDEEKSKYNDSIVFVEDAQQIWSNDVTYGAEYLKPGGIEIDYDKDENITTEIYAGNLGVFNDNTGSYVELDSAGTIILSDSLNISSNKIDSSDNFEIYSKDILNIHTSGKLGIISNSSNDIDISSEGNVNINTGGSEDAGLYLNGTRLRNTYISAGVGLSGNYTPNSDQYEIKLNTTGASNGDVLTVTNNVSGSIGVQWNPISIPTASSTSIGGIKTGYESTGDEKKYPVVLDDRGNAYVNVPWEGGGSGGVETDALQTNIGYTNGSIDMNGGSIDLDGGILKQGTVTVIDASGNISASTTNRTGGVKIGYEQNEKNYPVELNDDSQAYVNVPWTDTKNTVGATVIPSTSNGRIVLTNGNVGSEYTQSYVYQGCQFFTNGTSDLIQFGGSSVGGNYGNRDVSMTVNGTLNCKKLYVGGTSLSEDTFALTVATSNDLGGIKVGYTTDETNKKYAVQLENDKAYVNVPWTDTKNTTGSSDNKSNKLYLIGATSQNSQGIQTYSNGNVYIQSNAVHASGGFFESSDERLKDFGEKVSIDLDKLSELKKNYFTWKDSENKEQQLGVSAQEIRELYPEIVSEQENGTLTVAYDKLSVIALAAIDELHKKNKELENRLTALENKLK